MTEPQPDPRWLLKQVTEAVARLSDSADNQLAYVEALGSPGLTDELAQELDDVLEAAGAVPGLLSESQLSMLRALDDQLESMSGPENSRLWNEEAVRTSAEWAEVRRRARRALSELPNDRNEQERGRP
jgi:hypothetical protein